VSGEPLPHDTARLRLRRLREHDLPQFQAYRADPEVGRYQGWTPMALDTAAAFLREMAASPWCPPGAWFQLAIAERASDVLLGDIGLHLAADGASTEIGFSLARDAQHQGLGAEAVGAVVPLLFAHTAAERVRAITDVRNTASARLLARLGFRCYATLAAEFRGEPCEEHHFVQYRQQQVQPTFRAATAADADVVATVLIESRRALLPYAPSAHDEPDVRRWVATTLVPTGKVTVALLDERVAAVLAVRQDAAMGWIDQLYVHPLQVQRGLGRALLHHGLQALRGPVQLKTFQPNAAARRFYERHGFEPVAFGDGNGTEEGCPDVLYRLERPA
jgi:RimJ/RimL family protein N-acetyltransferase